MKHVSTLLLCLVVLNVLVCGLNICFGSVHIPFGQLFDAQWHYIVWQSRLPAAITALLTGAALGACGLLLQSYFRNPLAGPSILGITSGAQLAVTLVTLGGLSVASFTSLGTVSAVIASALMGAFAIMALLLLIGRYVRTQTTLLIVGILISYLTSAVITLLGYRASQQGLQRLMVWGMGDFGSVGTQGLPYYIILIGVGLLSAMLLVKPLNGWMMGELYARNLGIELRRTRWQLLLASGLLAAVTTAWCGPISFVGLSMPHAARLLLRTDDHRQLMPASMLLGALCCGLCLLLSTLPDGGTLLPINALTPVFGVPIIVYTLCPPRSPL